MRSLKGGSRLYVRILVKNCLLDPLLGYLDTPGILLRYSFDTPWILGYSLDTPWILLRFSFDTPWILGYSFDTPWILGYSLDTPLILLGYSLDTP